MQILRCLRQKIIIKIYLVFIIIIFSFWEIKSLLSLAIVFSLLISLRFRGPSLLLIVRERGSIDSIRIYLILLTIWLSLLIIITSLKAINYNMYFNIIIILILRLILRFRVGNCFMFYFFFEWSLIPIFIIVLGWGYQPERLRASLLLFFYTLFGSLPLLVVLLILRSFSFSFSFLSLGFLIFSQITRSWLLFTFIAVLAFIIKFPIYFVHLWLPKAHVEAPVAGSIILAGVLLKLGGYGVLRLGMFIRIIKTAFVIRVITIWGGGILGAVCLRIRDIKVLIAYSSVVHISLVITGALFHLGWGLRGVILIIVAHGICSSGIFAWANISYERRHSRRLILNKGALVLSPAIRIWWFLLLVRNFAGPFTLNLAGEILLIINIIRRRKIFWLRVSIISFFSAAYSLVIYSSTQQGVKVSARMLTVEPIIVEHQVIFSHTWPVFLLIVSVVIS